MKKHKFIWGQVAVAAFFLIIGGVCGLLLGRRMGQTSGEPLQLLKELFLLLTAMYLAILVQTILHEAGHLVFGLLTGYQFGSFRIGDLMLVSENGKLRFRRLCIAGTGGQCLMCPPDMKDGKIPVILYNLGGSLMNLIFGVLCLCLWYFLPQVIFVSELLLMLAIMGMAYALVNGIPLQLGMVDNDGCNAISIHRDPQAMRAWWIQLKANEQVSKGVRLRDMPAEWFEVPDEQAMKNSIVATLGVFACNRLMDEHKFPEADALMKKLLNAQTGIVGLHRNLMTCDRIYCELIGQKRTAVLEALYDKQQQRFEKTMARHPGILRVRYARELLWECRGRKAALTLELFEKSAASYPYPSEMEAERELIAIAKEKKAPVDMELLLD